MPAPDPRVTPIRADLAAEALRGRLAAPRYAVPQPMRCAVPVAPVRGSPGDPRRVTELLFGEVFEVLDIAGGLAWGQAARDGYVGYVAEDALAPPRDAPSHRVAALLTHLYPVPDQKVPPALLLPFGAELHVRGEEGRFLATPHGFVPASHLEPLDRRAPDPVAVATRFLGAPYLWGGRSFLGIDCSGLVQLALRAAGDPAPRDSDQQEAACGRALAPGAPLRRGDLVFWKGHVGFMRDAVTLLHATGFHMAVVEEPLDTVAARVADLGGGPVTSRRRL